MPMKVTVDHPSLPDGYKLGIAGFPSEIENRRTFTLSDEEVEQFELNTGKSLKDTFAGSEMVKLETTSITPATTSTNTPSSGTSNT